MSKPTKKHVYDVEIRTDREDVVGRSGQVLIKCSSGGRALRKAAEHFQQNSNTNKAYDVEATDCVITARHERPHRYHISV